MKSASPVDDYYTEVQRAFDIRHTGDYARLVVPNGNASESVHRWFHMKEAFSCNLLHRVLKDLDLAGTPNLRILDPFCGVGTALVSALKVSAAGDLRCPTVYGIETNPFLQLAASAKVAALVTPQQGFMRFARAVAADAFRDRQHYELPALSTFRNPRYFAPEHVQELLRLRASLAVRAQSGDSELHLSLGTLGLGASVESSSNLRKDGRALRFVERDITDSPIDLFLHRCSIMEEDIPYRPVPGRGRVYQGDGTSMGRIDRRFEPFDIVICSPPYPNNIDYTEVYKLENWLLGFIETEADFADRRKASVHSHPSLRRPDRIDEAAISPLEKDALNALVKPIIDGVPPDRYRRARREVIEGYTVDMFLMVRAARNHLKPGGRMVVAVGNSAHGAAGGSHVIAADLLISRVANLAGIEVDYIDVARHLKRRRSTSPFLRESLIFATKGPPP